ncbi:MAG: AbrB/MazE/SpoVT family DNA-binding domain-containing protein [Gemmatimonadota bacterium]
MQTPTLSPSPRVLAETARSIYSSYISGGGMAVPEEYRAALFTTGGSQAVRLPAAFRFEGKFVRARREGNRVILEPIDKPKWPSGFWRWFDRAGPVTDDFSAPAPLPPAPHRDAALRRMDADGPED